MISTLYRGKNTRIIKVNPFHDDTTTDEKYQFTCSVVFSATGPSYHISFLTLALGEKGVFNSYKKDFDATFL